MIIPTDFDKFDAKKVRQDIKSKIKDDFDNSLINFKKASDDLKDKGFEVIMHDSCTMPFHLPDYFNPTVLTTITKDNTTILLEVINNNEIDLFESEKFIKEISKISKTASEYVEKVILYYATHHKGEIIYDIFNNPSKTELLKELPLLEPYMGTVLELLTKDTAEDDLFSYLNSEFNPFTISISYFLDIRDYNNAPSFIYSYVTEEGLRLYPEDCLDVADICEALNVAERYYGEAISEDKYSFYEYSMC